MNWIDSEKLKEFARKHPEDLRKIYWALANPNFAEAVVTLFFCGVMLRGARQMANDAIREIERSEAIQEAIDSPDFRELEKILIDKTYKWK